MSDHPQIMIVEARFYEDIADELVRGAAAALEAAGATFERYAVPGVFEIPAPIQMAIRSLAFTTYLPVRLRARTSFQCCRKCS